MPLACQQANKGELFRFEAEPTSITETVEK